MTSKPQHVIIIGAGLGGTALSIGLALQGIKSTLYEVRPTRGTIGGAVQLAPNALRILDRLGVYSTIQSQGFNFDKIRFISEKGSVIGDFYSGGKERYGYQALRIKRELLLKALHERAQELGVRIEFGKKCVSVSEHEEGATVQFADGTSATGDLVVGFDGIHSLVRPHVTGPSTIPRYTGFTAVGFAAPKSAIRFPSSQYEMPCMITGRKGNFGMMPRDHEGEEVGCFSTCEMKEDLGREGWARWAKEEALPWVRKVHQDWDDPVKSMLAALDPSDIHIWPTYELPPAPRWHTARVIIAGDAVHAMSPHAGQGAAQAFEDGALLSRALSLLSSSYPLARALDNWEKRRRERFEIVLGFTKRSSSTRRQTSALGEVVKEWGLWAFFLMKGRESSGVLNDYDVEKVDLMGEA